MDRKNNPNDQPNEKKSVASETASPQAKQARFGLEAKLGLALILVLLVFFGIVLTRRIMNPPPTRQPIADLPAKEPAADAAALRPDAKPANAPRTFVSTNKATVVPAKSGTAGNAKGSPPDAGQWAAASDDSKAKAAAGGHHPPPPSYMPNSNYAPAREPAGQAGLAMAGDAPAGAAKAAEASQAYDPFRGRSLPPAAGAERAPALPPMPGSDASARPREPAGMAGTVVAPSPPPRTMPAAEPRYGADHRYAAGPAPSPPNYGGAPAAPPHYGSTPAAPPGAGRAAAPAAVVAQPYPAYGNAYPAGGRGAAGMVRDPRNGDAYEIQPNDTYWSISEKLYGSGAYFKALAEHNRKKVPHEDDLQVGDVIAAPDVAQLEKLYPDLCPKPSRREPPRPRTTAVSVPRHTGGRMYVAQEGDTLYDIARRELGKASRWVDIYELNREALGSDYNYLPPGVQLVLPEGEAAGVITRRPGAAGPYYQR